jgi:hypothetical protein
MAFPKCRRPMGVPSRLPAGYRRGLGRNVHPQKHDQEKYLYVGCPCPALRCGANSCTAANDVRGLIYSTTSSARPNARDFAER